MCPRWVSYIYTSLKADSVQINREKLIDKLEIKLIYTIMKAYIIAILYQTKEIIVIFSIGKECKKEH